MELLVELLPSVGLLAIFAIVIRAVIHADRRERAAAERYGHGSESQGPASSRSKAPEDADLDDGDVGSTR